VNEVGCMYRGAADIFSSGVLFSSSDCMHACTMVLIINTKNCSLSIVLTATDQKPQKSLKR